MKEVGDAATDVVALRAAELVKTDLLAGGHADHLRPGDEHVAEVLDHEDEIGDGRRVDRAAGAGTGDDRELRHHAGGLDVAVEDVGIAGQADDPVLDPGAARVVAADAGPARADGEIHDLADLLGEDLAQRAAEDARVVREEEHLAAVDGAVAGDDAVAGDLLLPHPERLGTVDGKGVELAKRPEVDEQLDPLAGGQLPFGMLLFIRVAAPVHGIVLPLAQDVDLAFRGGGGRVLGRPGSHGLAARPRPVLTEHVAQASAHLSYGGIGPQCLPHRRQQVLAAFGRPAHVLQRCLDPCGITLCPQTLESLDLLALVVRADLDAVHDFLVTLEAVDPDDHAAAGFHRLLKPLGALLDRVLRVPGLDGRDGTAPPRDRGYMCVATDVWP